MAYWETFQNAYKRARDASDIDTKEEAHEAGGPIYSPDTPSPIDPKRKKAKYSKKKPLPFDPYIDNVSSSDDDPLPPVHPGGPGPYDWPEDPPSPTVIEELKRKRKAEKLRARKEEERKRKRAAERRKRRFLKKYGPVGRVFDPNAAYVDFEDGLSDDDAEFEDQMREEERRNNRRLEGRAKRAAVRKRDRDVRKQWDRGNRPIRRKYGALDVGEEYYPPAEDSTDEKEEAKKKRRAARRRAIRTKKAREEKEKEEHKKRAECTGYREMQSDTHGKEKFPVIPSSSTTVQEKGGNSGGSDGGGDSDPSSSNNGGSESSEERSHDGSSGSDSIVSDFDNSEDEDYNSDDERHSTDSDYEEYQDDDSASEDEGDNEDDDKDNAGGSEGNSGGNSKKRSNSDSGSENSKDNRKSNSGDTEVSLSPAKPSDNEETAKRKKAARPAALARARAGKVPARRPVKPANPTGVPPDDESSSRSSDDDDEDVEPDSDDFDDTATSYPALVGNRECGGPTKSGGRCKLKIKNSKGMFPHGCFHHRDFIPDVEAEARAAAAAESRERRVDRARRRKRLARKRQERIDDAMDAAHRGETTEENSGVLLPDLGSEHQGYQEHHQPQEEGITDGSHQLSEGWSDEDENNSNGSGGGWDNSGSTGDNQSDWSDNGGEGSSGGQAFDNDNVNNGLSVW
ncbi:hypothetical protein IFR05_014739 [Cadophora sp. M221]|nr:hypothetical protein IFR05_014739 [Cadophora sp. M221]